LQGQHVGIHPDFLLHRQELLHFAQTERSLVADEDSPEPLLAAPERRDGVAQVSLFARAEGEVPFRVIGHHQRRRIILQANADRLIREVADPKADAVGHPGREHRVHAPIDFHQVPLAGDEPGEEEKDQQGDVPGQHQAFQARHERTPEGERDSGSHEPPEPWCRNQHPRNPRGSILLVTQEHLILSPEKTLLSFRLAPISRRMWAHLVDLMILVGINTMATYLAFLFFMYLPEFAMALASFLSAFAFFGYFAICEAKFQGQTLGKKGLNIRVISADGTPITVRQAWMRNLLRIADFLPGVYIAGVTGILANQRAQRLGDMVAGTMVVVEPKVSTNFAAAPHRYGTHHFEQYLAELPNMTLEEYFDDPGGVLRDEAAVRSIPLSPGGRAVSVHPRPVGALCRAAPGAGLCQCPSHPDDGSRGDALLAHSSPGVSRGEVFHPCHGESEGTEVFPSYPQDVPG